MCEGGIFHFGIWDGRAISQELLSLGSILFENQLKSPLGCPVRNVDFPMVDCLEDCRANIGRVRDSWDSVSSIRDSENSLRPTLVLAGKFYFHELPNLHLDRTLMV